MRGQDGLLTAKLGAGARSVQRVARDRLRARLEGSAEARLVLVSAPAGFGKSTLLADWLETSGIRSAWLSLDRGDNDVVRFSRYLAAAAARLASSVPDDASFDASQPFDPDLAIARALEAFGGTSGGDAGGAVLVLDDYHLIEEPAVHALVGSLVERLPPHARLAIATRADPPLPLARLRARGELVELRAGDLRFTTAEAAALLRSAGAELAQEDVDGLTGRTEGWAAALRLAAVSLRDRPDQTELVRRFGASHRFILDYVVEEVLAGLPPDTREFLLRTSILERLTASLCEAVTGEQNGQARLDELERANLLIVPLDDERRWYRYHALFAEILRAQLASLHPDEVAGLHARASAWHEERADDDEAIHHALRSGDLERASRVVAVASGRYVNAGELSTTRRWLDALPRDVVRNHAQLAASYAWYFVLVGEAGEAAAWVEDAERALANGHDGGPLMRPGIPAQLAMLRSQLASIAGDGATAVTQARLAGPLIPPGLSAEAEATMRGTATVLLAVALRGTGDLDGATEAYTAALPDLRAGGNRLAVGRTIADLAAIAIQRHDAAGAVRLCESELARGDGGSPTAGTGAVWAALARARAELGQTETAVTAAHRALEIAGRSGDAPIVRSALETLSRTEARDAAGGTPPAAISRGSGRGIVEPLTVRELEVLRLVARGRSNSQIAAALFVTVGTVKSHVHAISGKLDAANRVEAVARGRELGLLD